MLIGTIQINKAEFPTLFSIALDYLPIQASSVPCERVFSSAKETDTLKRNRIHPVLMEALQTLKFSLKKERINFTGGWQTALSDMKRTTTKDLLAHLLDGDRQANTDALLNALSDSDDEDDNVNEDGNVNDNNDSGDDGGFEDVFRDGGNDAEDDDE